MTILNRQFKKRLCWTGNPNNDYSGQRLTKKLLKLYLSFFLHLHPTIRHHLFDTCQGLFHTKRKGNHGHYTTTQVQSELWFNGNEGGKTQDSPDHNNWNLTIRVNFSVMAMKGEGLKTPQISTTGTSLSEWIWMYWQRRGRDSRLSRSEQEPHYQSEPGCNGNDERGTQDSPDFNNWNLTIRCNLNQLNRGYS